MHLTSVKEVVIIPASTTTQFWFINQQDERGNAIPTDFNGCRLSGFRLTEVFSCY